MPADDLSSLDVSALDALQRLEADQRAIRVLSEKAAARRAREAEIYSRVTKDFEARLSALVAQAEPVRQRMRDDLKKMDAILRSAEDALNGARVQLQECEFRHEIGEFDREEFQRCQQAAQAAIKEKEAAVQSVEAMRHRYLELLPAGAAPSAAPAVVVAEPPPARVREGVPPPTPAGPTARSAGGDPSPDSLTMFQRPPSAADFAVPPAQSPAGAGEDFRTMLVTSAMLVEDRDGVPGTPHRLGPTTTIGRTPDNQIVVPLKEVSRKHAQIIAVAGGYVLRDLGSPNGTSVNGERVQEHKLQDGDKIVMGPAAFTFKAS
jgi:FHA domain